MLSILIYYSIDSLGATGVNGPKPASDITRRTVATVFIR